MGDKIMDFPNKRYRTILADPPWPERGGGKIKRGADKHYPLMSVAEICALPVKLISENDAHLYLWVTNNYLPAGLEVMKDWGFKYKTMITWVKTGNVGLGQYFRGMTEHVLFGTRGTVEFKTLANGKRAQGRTAFTAERLGHSTKPETMHQMAELVSYAPRIELFARRERKYWDHWGNHAL